ncbi:MAG TPA: hypothetical protein VF843_03040 [Streptosporangiaceae bacterium]
MAHVIKTTLKLGAVAAVGAALAFGWQDIKRFVQIKQVSASGNHPEKIPVSGRTVYPQHAGEGQRDGTGDFDSASRGGPSLN